MLKKRRMSSNQRDSYRKYDTISLENRKTLVRLVLDEERSISKSAKRLGIKLSTAKLIIKKYKESGNFFERKKDRQDRERTQLKLQEQNRSNILTQQNNAPAMGSIGICQAAAPLGVAQPFPFFNIVEPNFYLLQCYPNQTYWV